MYNNFYLLTCNQTCLSILSQTKFQKIISTAFSIIQIYKSQCRHNKNYSMYRQWARRFFFSPYILFHLYIKKYKATQTNHYLLNLLWCASRIVRIAISITHGLSFRKLTSNHLGKLKILYRLTKKKYIYYETIARSV